ncbi:MULTISPECIES: phosphotransferase family protein [Parafrankia]|uniref:phosphotransferase family protein n=1 Tax=Parafrankia TaxID=2994362 RepID=UPI000B88EE62|nr:MULTISPECIES: phosphotransferase family protein [Parafrankia]MBE3200263.1 phosphotransferase family protein [Parafrankia sp. CH37]
MTDIDLDDVSRRATAAARRVHPDADVTGLVRLQGGVSSLTYAATMRTVESERPVVLKVAPPGLAPVRNRDVLRQAQVLRRLARLDGFPVPEVEFEDSGAPPAVPPLFGMARRPGESYEPGLDVSPAPPTAAVAAERMLVAARALARLQSRPPGALGLGAEPVCPPAEELSRWQRLFATVDADIGPGHEELSARLARGVPAGAEPRLLHGDFRLANMLFVGVTLESVIDWEIWSVGDPRSDLAWLLMHTLPAHVFHEDRPAADRAAASALPTQTALLSEYMSARCALGATPGEAGQSTTDLAWFLGVCHYKVAATIAVIYKRDRRRPEPDPALRVAARHLADVLEAGHRALDGW